jgi:hypothetical protein
MRYLLLLTTLVLLGACGVPTTKPAPATSSGDPVATANAALDALAAQDQATLLTLFDPAVGPLVGARIDAALDAWASHQTLTRTQVPGALGPVRGRTTEPTELRGQTTVVPISVTHQLGRVRWTISLRETDVGWRLLDIQSDTLEQHQP